MSYVFAAASRAPAAPGLGAWYDYLNPASPKNLIYQGTTLLWTGKLPETVPTGAPAAPPPVKQDTGFIPGSSISDYLLNAITGHATESQYGYNANQCIQNIQRMRQMQGGQAIPPDAEKACTGDQAALIKLQGGTAQDVLANVVKPLSVGSSAILWLLAIGAGIYVATR